METPMIDRLRGAWALLTVLGFVAGWPWPGAAQESGAVFVMANDSQVNEVVVFERDGEGLLSPGPRGPTAGMGTGG